MSDAPHPDGVQERDRETHVYSASEQAMARTTEVTRIRHYAVTGIVGSGGMGQVLAAYDPKLDRKVALKLLKTREDATPEQLSISRERLIREAKALAQLSHPNVVTVHDVDTWEGHVYMAMELVEGLTLGEWVQQTRPSWRDILRVYDFAGRGLAAAHARDIVHRDFKPSNVLIGQDGRVRVVDFGLAKSHVRSNCERASGSQASDADAFPITAEEEGDLTQAGRVLGTPAYMAPEQMALNRKEGVAIDQFSFAVSLYESLYKTLPFNGGTSRSERYAAIRAGAVREPPRDTEVPPWVFRVLCRALQFDPEARFPSMEALAQALSRDPRQRWRRLAFAGALAASVGLGAAGIAYGLARRAETCQGAHGKWTEVWSTEAQASLRSALASTGLSYAEDTTARVVAALDDYGRRWAEGRTDICMATQVHREQSEALLDVRMSCLDARLSEARALVGVLTHADAAMVERAVAAVYRLPPPEPCEHAEFDAAEALPPDAKAKEQVLRLRADLDHVQALLMAGRYGDAAEQATRARTFAEAIDHRPTLARAFLAEGRGHRFAGDVDRSLGALQSAVTIAAAADVPEVEAQAWINLIYLAGVEQNDPTTADAWRLAALSSLAREGNSPDLRLALRLNEGAVDLRANRFEGARQANRDVLDLGRSLGAREQPNVAMAWMNLGVIAARLNQYEEAEQALRRVLALHQELFGPGHPAVADAALNLANILLRNGALEEAEAFALQALKIREGARGPHARDVIEARNTLAVLYMQSERWDEAEGLLRQSLEALHDEGPSELVSMIFNNLGAIAAARGHVQDALALHQDALRGLQTLYGTTPQGRLSIARTRMRICQAAPKAHDPAQHLPDCDRALDVLEEVYREPNDDLLSLYAARASLHESIGAFEAARLDRAHLRSLRQHTDD